MRKLRQRRRRGTVLGVFPVVLSVQVLGPLPVALTLGCLLGSQRPAGLLGAFLTGWFILTTSSDYLSGATTTFTCCQSLG